MGLIQNAILVTLLFTTQNRATPKFKILQCPHFHAKKRLKRNY